MFLNPTIFTVKTWEQFISFHHIPELNLQTIYLWICFHAYWIHIKMRKQIPSLSWIIGDEGPIHPKLLLKGPWLAGYVFEVKYVAKNRSNTWFTWPLFFYRNSRDWRAIALLFFNGCSFIWSDCSLRVIALIFCFCYCEKHCFYHGALTIFHTCDFYIILGLSCMYGWVFFKDKIHTKFMT